jgi:hypothetical protein
MHSMMDKVGAQAGRRAQDILEVWDDADPHWSHFGKVYPSKAGEEPFDCLQRFVQPAVEKWMRKYWAALTVEAPVAIAESLEEALKLDTLRGVPSMGIRLFEEQAAACASGMGAGAAAEGSPLKRKKESGADGAGGADAKCKHCGTETCYKPTCWKLHPGTKPGWMQARGRWGRRKVQAQRLLQQHAQMGQQQPEDALQQQQMQQYAQPPAQQAPGQQYAPGYMPHGYMQYAPPQQQAQGPPVGGAQLQGAPVPPAYPPPGAMLQLQDKKPGAGAAGMPGGFVPLAERECFKCGEKGHMASSCPAK